MLKTMQLTARKGAFHMADNAPFFTMFLMSRVCVCLFWYIAGKLLFNLASCSVLVSVLAGLVLGFIVHQLALVLFFFTVGVVSKQARARTDGNDF